VKVEPERWYYHTDQLGLLVWQDMPSADNVTDEGKREFTRELEAMVAARRNHPSIVMWVPFNEGWGQHETARVVARVKALDPTRLVNNASGWTDAAVGDVMDIHAYPGPAAPPNEPARAAVLGEFGGLGLPIEGHLWQERGAWGYRRYRTLDDLGVAYLSLMDQLRFLVGEGLSAAVYTQTTDVEIEVNGIMTYDREIVKLPAVAPTYHARLYGPAPVVRPVVPTSRTVPQEWRYTTTAPPEGWQSSAFDDRRWSRGAGGFGTERTPGAAVRTAWTTSDLWLRRTFELGDTAVGSLYWNVHHDEDAEAYLNGTLAARFDGYTAGYVFLPLNDGARGALRLGRNTLAVHVRQTDGGQYIDVGLAQVVEP
jgi:hypothetical protein